MCASVTRIYCWFTKNAIEKRKKINNNVYFCAFFRVDIFYKIERSFGAKTLNVLDSHAQSLLLLLLFQLIHGLSFIHVYPLSAYVGDPNTSTQIIGFILFFCECSREKTLLFVVVLSLYSFSHAFLLYIYVQTIRVVTHPHLKFVWIFVVVSFFLLCCFLFFVFVFICSFDLILPHCIGSLFYWISNIFFAIVCTSQRANSLKFNLIFVSI